MNCYKTTPNLPFFRVCLKTYFLLAKPQLSKLKLDIPKLGLGNEEGFETTSSKGRAEWGCLKQLTFNFIFSIELNIILRTQNVLDSTVIKDKAMIL